MSHLPIFTDDDFDKEIDFSNGLRGDNLPPRVKKLRTKLMQQQADESLLTKALDADVVKIINEHAHNPRDRMRINSILRAMFS